MNPFIETINEVKPEIKMIISGQEAMLRFYGRPAIVTSETWWMPMEEAIIMCAQLEDECNASIKVCR